MSNLRQPTVLVIIGITGNLARRKLLPAIERLAAAQQLPEHFRIVGISRRDVSARRVLDGLTKARGTTYPFLKNHLEMFRMDLDQADEYHRLRTHLDQLAASFGGRTQRLFYLSVPAQSSLPIVEHLGAAGLSSGSAKLLPEKPFGSDLPSAKELITQIERHFAESRVYRIDHYLAKDMAQNILVFRAGNSLLKHTWNKDFIERIEITAAEKIDIEGRATFYERTGALRDFVQSHLLQLAALTLMELPPNLDNWKIVPRYRLAALESLMPPRGNDLDQHVTRGQYKGYADAVDNPDTQTETFVSLTLFSKDPRWQGVPIVLTTGKALHAKYTEICIHYRQDDCSEANQLIFRIQPKEGIELSLWSKRPGLRRRLERVRLNFEYGAGADRLPDAYEQVLVDAIRSDHTLFTSGDEVLASWQILAPIQQYWAKGGRPLIHYAPGTKPSAIIGVRD